MTRVGFGIVETGFVLMMALCLLILIAGAVVVIWALFGAGRRRSTAAVPANPVSPAPSTPAPQTPAAPQTPLETLQMRYARGEITKEQYDEMRRELGV